MVESFEYALQQHHQHNLQRCHTKRPARQLIKRRSSGRVPVVSGGTKRVAAVAPLTSAKLHPATTSTTGSNNSKSQPVEAITDDNNTSSRKASISLPPSSVASAVTPQPPQLSRTQQKLFLQRQQCLTEDEMTMVHPNKMRGLTHELDRVGCEYRSVKQFQDPMNLSLARCVLQKYQQQPISEAAAVAAVHRRHQELKAQQQHKNMQRGRDGKERRNRKSPSSASAEAATTTNNPLLRWSAGSFLDRVLWNVSRDQ